MRSRSCCSASERLASASSSACHGHGTASLSRVGVAWRRVHGACDRVLAYSGSGVGTLLLAVELDRRLSLQLLKLAAHLQPGSAREYSRVLRRCGSCSSVSVGCHPIVA